MCHTVVKIQRASQLTEICFSLFGRRRREEFVNQFRNMTSSFLPLPRPSRRRMPQAKLQLLLLEFLFMVQSSFFVPIKLALHTYITLQFTDKTELKLKDENPSMIFIKDNLDNLEWSEVLAECEGNAADAD